MKEIKFSGYYNGHQHFKEVRKFLQAVKILMLLKQGEEVKIKCI